MSTTLRRYLTVPEVCELLTLKRRTLYRRMGDRLNPIPHHKIGGRVLFDPEAVTRWLDDHEVTSHRGED